MFLGSESMASPVPAKSQPLHNFSMPHWKWKKNHSNNHLRRRRSPPSSTAPPPLSPIHDSASESDSISLKNMFVSDNNRINSPLGIYSLGKKPIQSDLCVDKDDGIKERKSKIYIRFGKKKVDEVPTEDAKAYPIVGEVEESVPKTWNLRPRRPIYKLSNGNLGIPKGGGSPVQENKSQLPQSEVLTAEKNEKKQKFSIALSGEEIEEDIFAMTGSKPSRRPKKRAKAVRKQLDNLFPGLWLALITPDSYKVSDLPATKV
ncbi:hypothetical protein LguiB_023512 [Lonicera macranthoides]